MSDPAKEAQIRNCPHNKTEKHGNGYWVWTFCKLCGLNLEKMLIATGESRKIVPPMKYRNDTGMKVWNLPKPYWVTDGED